MQAALDKRSIKRVNAGQFSATWCVPTNQDISHLVRGHRTRAVNRNYMQKLGLQKISSN